MCLAPVRLQDGTMVACRGCRLCRDNRINDLVGRCVAEQATSDQAFSVTLTYAGDVPEATILRYRDVQLFLKRLRKDGYSVRYICAGEYGTKKGRAHWHVVLFFVGKKLKVERDARVQFEYWPHGFVYFQQPDYRGFRYAMKYALKDMDSEGASRALSMSKKPPLGYRFFVELADDLVERRLPVHSPSYAFAHVRNKDGKARQFWLQGRMREMFLDRYQTMWRLLHKSDPPATDFYQDRYEDPIYRALADLDTVSLDTRDRLKYWQKLRLAVSERQEQQDREPQFLGYLFFRQSGGYGMVEAYTLGIAKLSIGTQEPWTLKLDAAVPVEAQLRRIGLRLSNIKPVSLWLHQKWGLLP